MILQRADVPSRGILKLGVEVLHTEAQMFPLNSSARFKISSKSVLLSEKYDICH